MWDGLGPEDFGPIDPQEWRLEARKDPVKLLALIREIADNWDLRGMNPSPTILRLTPPATTPTLSHSPGGGRPKKVSSVPTRSSGGGRKPNNEAVETTPIKSTESAVEHGVQQCALKG